MANNAYLLFKINTSKNIRIHVEEKIAKENAKKKRYPNKGGSFDFFNYAKDKTIEPSPKIRKLDKVENVCSSVGKIVKTDTEIDDSRSSTAVRELDTGLEAAERVCPPKVVRWFEEAENQDIWRPTYTNISGLVSTIKTEERSEIDAVATVSEVSSVPELIVKEDLITSFQTLLQRFKDRLSEDDLTELEIRSIITTHMSELKTLMGKMSTICTDEASEN